ncbi:glycosyltransferase [Peribacillus frigoritolerans]|uniref:glycosyltransferase n=1 Tax=Peribacillus frigoritolerans TaxID=450367 RepID=UPI0037FB5503
MKILYFGTVCTNNEFEKVSEKSKVKPSAAPQNFENLLLNGFSEIENAEIECNTFPPIAAYPSGYLPFWGRKRNIINNKIVTKWIPAINIQVLKQAIYFFLSFFITLLWARRNPNENKIVLLYSIYAPIAYGTLLASKITNSKICVVVPDLPQFMFSYSIEKGIKAKLSPFFIRLSNVIQSKFDGYILLTEFMNEVVNKNNKPYIVMEGIAKEERSEVVKSKNSTYKNVIMYAGALNEKFGIDKLINAFELSEDKNAELWLFGSGDMKEKILAYASKNNKIIYFGRKPKADILEYERKATLLVNTRTSEDAYTKYSFPSKTIEYMVSGTPLLTTKLPGIPAEYFDYCYTIEDETVEGISKSINQILNLPKKEREYMGEKAKKFINDNKNSSMQAAKIYHFLKSNMF